MKTFACLLTAMLLCVGSSQAAGANKSVKWLDDFSAAKAEARKAGKPILANFTGSDWCPWCVKLDKEVFSQKAFLDYAGTNVVLFIADYPNRKKLPAKVVKENEGLKATYAVKGFPTVLLMDADGKVLGQTGYQPGGPDPFVTNVKDLLEKSGWKPATATNQTEKAAAPATK
jgi:protein disulfide-isomerase